MSTDRRMDKVVYIHNGIVFSHKKNEIILFAATQMDLEINSEVSQKEKNQYHMMSLICEI